MPMARTTSDVHCNLLLSLSFLLLILMAEGTEISPSNDLLQLPVCELVHGVKSGETCDAITKLFELTPEKFTAINPNLNCDALFVGQWVCVIGTA